MAAATLAACSGSPSPISAPLSPSAVGLTAQRVHSASKYSVLYSFGGYSGDGLSPLYESLLNVNGTLYGTTSAGGAYEGEDGTVFSITRSGKETVIHSFGHAHDGADPDAGLINVNGTLYGTTGLGGAYGYGTVFSITQSGAEKVLHSFGGGSSGDGGEPTGSLINVNGTLYGTTAFGGDDQCSVSSYDHGCGVVFAITTSGAESVIYRFGGHPYDGEIPEAHLTNVNGTLYSTTLYGGVDGSGTVFSVTPSGTEKVLHSFGASDPEDAAAPYVGLINVNGTLYGTTSQGGAYNDGAVFSITRSGKESVIYSFGAYPKDGQGASTSLTNFKGTLYGATIFGGTAGHGSVFSMTLSGKETIRHSFGGSGGARGPYGGLINVNGTLYATTSYGGAYGDGIVYGLSP